MVDFPLFNKVLRMQSFTGRKHNVNIGEKKIVLNKCKSIGNVCFLQLLKHLKSNSRLKLLLIKLINFKRFRIFNPFSGIIFKKFFGV